MIALALVLISSSFSTIENISFVGPRGWTFQGRIHLPESKDGPAVFMIGGGIGNDLDWSTPGSLQIGDNDVQVTISGELHNDAAFLANAFIGKECLVMHYSTVSKNDPKSSLYPYELSLTEPLEVMQVARAAYEAFIQSPSVQGRPIVVLGFSMGAQRALQLASEHDEIASIVILSGAQMSATDVNDTGGNVHREASKAIADPPLDVYDFDGDGIVRLWEVSGSLAIHARNTAGKEHLPKKDRFGMPFGEPILHALQKPTLMIYGSLDEAQSGHAVILSEDKSQHGWLDIRVIPNVGHQLGPIEDGKIGPIDEDVCAVIAHWVICKKPIGKE